jgi:hypothetical protein
MVRDVLNGSFLRRRPLYEALECGKMVFADGYRLP